MNIYIYIYTYMNHWYEIKTFTNGTVLHFELYATFLQYEIKTFIDCTVLYFELNAVYLLT
jgi:hypothetical protein